MFLKFYNKTEDVKSRNEEFDLLFTNYFCLFAYLGAPFEHPAERSFGRQADAFGHRHLGLAVK
jgi:hypothetical protein